MKSQPSLIKSIIMAGFLMLFIVTSTLIKTATALELGFTPNHVYSLWINVNQAVLTYGEQISPNTQWLIKVKQMQPQPVTDKVPADVLKKAKEVSSMLAVLTKPQLYQRLSNEVLLQLSDGVEEIKPTDIYLFSSVLLHQTITLIVTQASKDIAIGALFKPLEVVNKTPSDVFAQVALAQRRLAAIIQHQTSLKKRPQKRQLGSKNHEN
ncbi:MAG: hypothetical protein ACI9FJ_001057 [Alteromonadaceae bacterium]|jgi:hypothetical protein